MARMVTTTQARKRPDPALTDGIAPLTEAEVRDQTDDGSFSRGRGYYKSKEIFDPVRRGTTLRAQCHGSSGGPYLVGATLAAAGEEVEENPVDFDCDCPRGGFCKHIVALLLTWIHEPERFDPRPPLADLLADKSRDELVALVEVMTKRYPDLESLVELPLPVLGGVPAQAVDEATVRRQVAVAFRDDGYDRRGRYDYDDYHYASRVAGKLEPLLELGNRYAETGQWSSAVSLFATLAEESLAHLDEVQDDEGDLGAIVSTCDLGLANALDAQAGLSEPDRLPPDERARLLKTSFAIWLADVEQGGVGLAEEGPEAIARDATDEEQAEVAGWLHDAMAGAAPDGWNRGWQKRAAIGFLSMLRPGIGLDEEGLLVEYRNAELWDEAASTLVGLGRVEEAIALAARRFPSAIALTRFADGLVATGDPLRVEQAIALVDGRLWEREGQNAADDLHAMEWLEKHYAAHGQPAKTLDLARRRFTTAPSEMTYDAVKAAALLPGQPGDPWPTLRPDLMETLRKQGQAGALIEIHLADGEVGEALAVLKLCGRGAGGAAWGWGGAGAYQARVAEAAERDFPADAIRLYRGLAARQIEARQRGNYREAAGYLARVKRLLEGAGRGDDWRSLISDLRQEHKSLRALRDELDALGLA